MMTEISIFDCSFIILILLLHVTGFLFLFLELSDFHQLYIKGKTELNQISLAYVFVDLFLFKFSMIVL